MAISHPVLVSTLALLVAIPIAIWISRRTSDALRRHDAALDQIDIDRVAASIPAFDADDALGKIESLTQHEVALIQEILDERASGAHVTEEHVRELRQIHRCGLMLRQRCGDPALDAEVAWLQAYGSLALLADLSELDRPHVRTQSSPFGRTRCSERWRCGAGARATFTSLPFSSQRSFLSDNSLVQQVPVANHCLTEDRYEHRVVIRIEELIDQHGFPLVGRAEDIGRRFDEFRHEVDSIRSGGQSLDPRNNRPRRRFNFRRENFAEITGARDDDVPPSFGVAVVVTGGVKIRPVYPTGQSTTCTSMLPVPVDWVDWPTCIPSGFLTNDQHNEPLIETLRIIRAVSMKTSVGTRSSDAVVAPDAVCVTS